MATAITIVEIITENNEIIILLFYSRYSQHLCSITISVKKLIYQLIEKFMERILFIGMGTMGYPMAGIYN